MRPWWDWRLARVAPRDLRIRAAVKDVLNPYVEEQHLPGVRLFLGDAFRLGNEPPERCERRWLRVVDATVREVVRAFRLPAQAPPTACVLLDTVPPWTLAAQTVEANSVAARPIGPSPSDLAVRDDQPATAHVEPGQIRAIFLLTAGTRLTLEHGSILGGPHAAPPAIRLDAPCVSARHARVTIRGHRVRGRQDYDALVEDLASRHGTRINGKPLNSTATRLTPGDIVSLADYQLRFIGVQTADHSKRYEEN